MGHRHRVVIRMRHGREDEVLSPALKQVAVYDLRGVPPGGPTRDVDTGRLFRRP
jgi:hypothetical protein